MTIHPKEIGFDIDGVVADTMEAFIRLARDEFGVDTISPDDITAFRVEECLAMDPKQVDAIFDRLLEEPLAAGLRPMPHAAVVLEEFSKMAPLTFLTARPHAKPIAEWLKIMLGDSVFHRARLVAMGEHDGKAEYIKELGLKFFVDDRVETCMLLDKEGITPIVYTQPWNRGKHDLRTVDCWLSIRDLCVAA